GADVDVVASAGGEPECVLAHQQRAFTDRAGARYGSARDTHAATVANESSYPQPAVPGICKSHMYRRRGWHGRGGRIERFQVAALLLLLSEHPAPGYDLLQRLPPLLGAESAGVWK